MRKKAKKLLIGLFLAAVAVMTVEITGAGTGERTDIIYPAGMEKKQVLLSNAGMTVETAQAKCEDTSIAEEETEKETEESVPMAENLQTEEGKLSGEGVPVGETDRQSGENGLTEEKEDISPKVTEEKTAESVPVPEQTLETVVIEEENTPTAPSFDGNENQTVSAEAEKMTVSALLESINAERSGAGVAPLGYSEELAAAAGVRSVEAVSRFNHTRPDGTDFFTVSELAMAENLARGSLGTTAQEIVNKWMESTGGHRQNILDAGLYTIGIAIYEKDGQLTICALFG